MRKRPIRRTVAVVMAAFLCSSSLFGMQQTAAHASSSVGGPITPAEMFSRAQYWVDRGFTYSQTSWIPDLQGRTYRADCSGLVSMAWHLSTSYVTATFPSSGVVNFIGSVDQLQPGDAVLDPGDHMELFVKWKTPSDHQQGAYVYSFNRQGETVENPYASSNFGHLGFDSWSELTSYPDRIRYKNVIGGTLNRDDFNGDGRSDVLARNATDHDLYLYRGNGSGGFSGSSDIGNNWSGIDAIVRPGDFNGDGEPDVLARNATDHDLYLYRGNGTGGFSGSSDISNNWSNMSLIMSPGDFDGDGRPDILARNDTDHDLYLYRGSGSGGFSGTSDIGNNWSGIDAVITPGDFNGDGHVDVIARNATDHDLYLYRGNGAGGFSGSSDISNNWSNMSLLMSPGDFDGDGNPDILARNDTDHDLYLYRGSGSGGFSGTSDIGNNWSGIDYIS